MIAALERLLLKMDYGGYRIEKGKGAHGLGEARLRDFQAQTEFRSHVQIQPSPGTGHKCQV